MEMLPKKKKDVTSYPQIVNGAKTETESIELRVITLVSACHILSFPTVIMSFPTGKFFRIVNIDTILVSVYVFTTDLYYPALSSSSPNLMFLDNEILF
jgi:hypothetical protein